MFNTEETDMKHRGHGIALFSGGLDSAIAILLILQQDIEVTALSFMNHFGCDIVDKSSCSQNPYPVAERFGFTVKMVHLGQKFVDIVRDPKHGHGKNMNPCIDCRILMLKEAAQFMDIVGADFVFTGEVIGQRPMSQHRRQMDLITRESGLGDRLVRPLSGKLLPETEPERRGILDRDKLEAISGRSRKRQMELADKYGLEDYPNPAAGCLLTDPGYSRRLRDYFAHHDLVTFNDLNLLKVGRHFRPDDASKIIVGRNETENEKIERYRHNGDWLFEARDAGSPITLLKGELTDKTIALAAAITARYCSQRDEDQVEITYWTNPDETRTITVPPATEELLAGIRL
jgi:tRNA U34 2-thiouridine synthase MnmA/TrmU